MEFSKCKTALNSSYNINSSHLAVAECHWLSLKEDPEANNNICNSKLLES